MNARIYGHGFETEAMVQVSRRRYTETKGRHERRPIRFKFSENFADVFVSKVRDFVTNMFSVSLTFRNRKDINIAPTECVVCEIGDCEHWLDACINVDTMHADIRCANKFAELSFIFRRMTFDFLSYFTQVVWDPSHEEDVCCSHTMQVTVLYWVIYMASLRMPTSMIDLRWMSGCLTPRDSTHTKASGSSTVF